MALLSATDFPLEASPQPERALITIRGGRGGVADTLDLMVAWAREYCTDARVFDLARDIVRPLMSRDYLGEAAAIQDWVRNHVRYTQDILDVETLQTPPRTLDYMQGDCDDQALLAGTMLRAVGHPVRFVAVAFEQAGDFEHVYCEFLYARRRWVALETTVPCVLGHEPPTSFPPMIRTV